MLKSVLHVEMRNMLRLCRGSDLSKLMINLLKLTNMPTPEWIIHPSLRNNGSHCLLVQVRKLVGEFNSRLPLSLCWELSGFIHLKQGNGVRPYALNRAHVMYGY